MSFVENLNGSNMQPCVTYSHMSHTAMCRVLAELLHACKLHTFLQHCTKQGLAVSMLPTTTKSPREAFKSKKWLQPHQYMVSPLYAQFLGQQAAPMQSPMTQPAAAVPTAGLGGTAPGPAGDSPS